MKKKKNRVGRWKLSVIILSLLLFLALGFYIVVKLFTVESVEVEGNELYESSVIEDTVLQDKYSWNSLYVYIKYKFFQKSGQVPFIDTMEISLKTPHTLHVKVYEKGMMGYLYIDETGENAYFDKDGFVVETSTRVIEDVPKIVGISCEDVKLLEKLPVESGKLKDILVITQKLKGEELIPDSIDYSDDDCPVLVYKEVKIKLGTISNLTQKVARLKKIYPTIKDEKGTLHLENWNEESPNIVFDKEADN